MSYSHLTEEERYTIYSLNKGDFSIAHIAEITGRHRSTIWRELKRNRGKWDLRDQLLKTDSNAADGWSATIGSGDLPIGENMYFARAYNGKLWSDAATTTGNVLADADGDGLPDEWEMDMLSTLEYDGDADPDGDGWSNLQEYENGTDPLRYVLELNEGWNLVSIALAPTDYSVDGIFGDTIDKPAWYWDGGVYNAAEDILPLAGQWVYSPAEETVFINIGGMAFPDSPDSDGDGLCDSVEEDIGTDPERYAIELHPGWNLISICRAATDNSPEAIFGDKIIMPVWQWQDGQYKRAGQIKPLKGYWVYFDGEQPATIIITRGQGLAPKNLASGSVSCNVTEATYSDDLGLFTYNIAPDGTFYGGATSGTYSYTKTGADTAQIEYTSKKGYSGTLTLHFTSETSGTFVENYTGPYSGESFGTFSF